MFGLIKNRFMGLLIDIDNASNYTKCVLLSNKKCWYTSTSSQVSNCDGVVLEIY